MNAPRRRDGIARLREQGISERRAGGLVGLSRSVLRYSPTTHNTPEWEERIRVLAAAQVRWGYRRVWEWLRREGRTVNRKRIHRLWRKLGLQVPRRKRKPRRKSRGTVPLAAQRPNHVWTWDFIHDSTRDGRGLKSLTVSDEFTREGLAIETDRRMPAARVVEVLTRLVRQHGAPAYVRSDNGPEFVARRVQRELAAHGIEPYYIHPGSPWENAFGESFNGRFRDECLNVEVYDTVPEAQVVHERWRRHYNTARPHSGLGYHTPAEFKAAWRGPALGAPPPNPRIYRIGHQT